jgi:hypothetical protein
MNKVLMVSVSLAAVFSCSINALATDFVPNPEEILEQVVPAEGSMYTAPEVAPDAVPIPTPAEPAPETAPVPAEPAPEPSAPDPGIIIPVN